MKHFNLYFAMATLAISPAEARPKFVGGIQEIIATDCTAFNCSAVYTDSIDCTIEMPMNKAESTLSDFMNMTEAEREEFSTEAQSRKEDRRQHILECACCTENGLEELMSTKKEAAGNFESGLPTLEKSRPIEAGGNDNSESPGGSGITIKEMLDEKCPAFNCASIDEDSVDCDHFHSMANGGEENHNNMLFCGCCHGLNGVGKSSGCPVMIKSHSQGGSSSFGPDSSSVGGRPSGGMAGLQSQSESLESDSGPIGRPGQSQGGNIGSDTNGTTGSGSQENGAGGNSMDIHSLLDEKCPTFDCLSIDSQSIDCSRFDSMMTRGRRRQGMLFCGCCANSGSKGLRGQNGDELAAFLALASSAESEIVN